MLYSVWNWYNKQYDYYEAEGPHNGDPLPSPQGLNGKTVALETALPVVPSPRVKIGGGGAARGRVAVLSPNDGVYAAVGLGETSEEASSRAVKEILVTLGLGLVSVWALKRLIFR